LDCKPLWLLSYWFNGFYIKVNVFAIEQNVKAIGTIEPISQETYGLQSKEAYHRAKNFKLFRLVQISYQNFWRSFHRRILSLYLYTRTLNHEMCLRVKKHSKKK